MKREVTTAAKLRAGDVLLWPAGGTWGHLVFTPYEREDGRVDLVIRTSDSTETITTAPEAEVFIATRSL